MCFISLKIKYNGSLLMQVVLRSIMFMFYLPDNEIRGLFEQKMVEILPNLQTSLPENGNF